MPVFMRWLYYVFPFSWATRALAANEFGSPRYDEIVDGVRLGDSYMTLLNFELGMEWIGYAIFYFIAVAIFIMTMHSINSREWMGARFAVGVLVLYTIPVSIAHTTCVRDTKLKNSYILEIRMFILYNNLCI
jgi:hypothetical protein